MPTPDLTADLRPICLSAGDAVLKHYDEGVEVVYKADCSPVTAADLAADAIIDERLRTAFPDIPIITEERAEAHTGGAPGRRFFLIDPLDGTKEFVKRGGDFTVNIALIEDGAATQGVVYAPAKGRLFSGGPEGAWTEEGPSGGRLTQSMRPERRPIGVVKADNAALRVVASLSHRTPETNAYIRRYQTAAVVSAGSSLKLCLIATGEADLYPRLGPTMEWDTAAGHAVLAAAGGMVERLEGGPLVYGKSGFRNPAFVARSPTVQLMV